MADTNNTGSINDAYATSQTIDFIDNLKTKLADAKSNLSQKQMKLNNATATKNTLSNQYTSSQAAATLAQSSLEEAEKAQKQIDIISGFFAKRMQITSEMVQTATVTAIKMYEATEFVGKRGLDRIEDILNIVIEYNKKDTNPSTQWTNPFISSVQVASAKGQTALNTSTKATKDAFMTLVSTLQIDSRTKSYYQQCQSYQSMMINLISRLSSEYILLKVKADNINQKLEEVELKLSLLETETQKASFAVAQLQAEFTAAQKGASYTGSAVAAS